MRPLLLAAVLATGCDSLASGDYVGQPMFTLVGTFASSTTAPEAPVGGIALVWQDPRGPGGPGIAVTVVPVDVTFPAAFRVDVPTPPPDAARFGFDDADLVIAEAYVYVVADPTAARPHPRGADRTHVLVYASADVADGTFAADYLGGPITAGYHLRAFAPTATPGAAQTVMIDRCRAFGGAPNACAVRRGYQLASIADDDPLHIVVRP